jgi:hypothetical protein
VYEFVTNFAGFIPITGIESGLSTTGLFNVVFDHATSSFQYFYGIESGFGV